MTPSAHVDTFARDRLPPPEAWPEFRLDPPYRYAERLNCTVELLDRQIAAGAGDRIALRTSAAQWTYGDLQQRVDRIARVLTEDMGLVPGNRVLLRGANTPAMAACWLAVVKAGLIAVATMPLLRARELQPIIDKARIGAALCDASLRDELETAGALCPDLRQVRLFNTDDPDGLDAAARAKAAGFPGVATAADDVCLIAFTSGTTGHPKGTMHFHRDVLAICDAFPPACLHPTPDDIFCGTPPLAFTFGLGGLLLFPLRYGASSLLVEKATPAGLLEAIAAHRATVCFTAPTFYRQMAPLAANHDLSSLRRCVSAGEALPVATREAWERATGHRLIDGIGATEMLHIFIAAADDAIRPGATGLPLPGYEAAILDEDGAALPPGKTGRLAVRGPTGCRYLDDPRQHEYVQHGWNLTGDLCRRDADGYFWYEARADDMIVSAGYNIAGPEVEAALLQHPAVAECAVIGAPDEERGRIVKAFVVVRPGVEASDRLALELQDFVKRTIAPYKYPRTVVFRTALPRTETGKIQRFRLRSEPDGAGTP